MDLFVKNQKIRNAASNKKLSFFLNEIIVTLLILQVFLSALIPDFKILQALVELTIFLFLCIGLIGISLSFSSQVLLFAFLIAMGGAFFLSTTDDFLRLLKNNGLAVLTLIYFTEISFRSKLIFPVILLSLCLMFAYQLSPEIIGAWISISANKEFNMSRFGGFFLDTHINALFLAIPFIYYAQMSFSRGAIGIVALSFTGSKYILVSYALQVIYSCTYFKFFRRHNLELWIIGVFSGILIVALIPDFKLEVLKLMSTINTETAGKYFSAQVILSQLLDPAYYTFLFNVFPSAYTPYIVGSIDLYSGETFFHDGANEIGYFALFSQFGIFLSITFLCVLFRNTKYYRIFICLTLLHNNLLISPIIIYMLVQYSRDIRIKN